MDMTLLLPALMLAILLVSVTDVPGGTQADLIVPMALLALAASVLTSAAERRGIAGAFSVVRHDTAGDLEGEPAAVITASGLRRSVVAPVGLRIRHWGHDHSGRRSMNRYIQTVVADLGALSLKPASATYAIRAGRRVAGASPLLDIGILPAATPSSPGRVPSRRA
jgi:hypothetical protein